jgi:hypothetical protein
MLTKIPLEWDSPTPDSPLEQGSVSLLNYLLEEVYDDYEPAEFSTHLSRIIAWLNNVESEREQQLLLALLLDTFYAGRREFQTLYRATFRNSIVRWLINQHQLDPFSENLEDTLVSLTNASWICPISDSLRINSFLKTTGLQSKDIRPDWRSLAELGDTTKISDYVQKAKIRNLILLEDFVGSGTQALRALQFAKSELNGLSILLAPMIVCPDGHRTLSEFATNTPNVTYCPTLLVPSSELLTRSISEPPTEMEQFVLSMRQKLNLSKDEDCFGYKQTGAKVVLFSNCPNNTLPIFHAESDSWKPLFPRVERQP